MGGVGDALLIAQGSEVGAGLFHADLHNHTLLSDGDGEAEAAFASMRAAGLDVAAVTDHAYGPCEAHKTIDDEGWRRLGRLADAADAAGDFVAVRGFEWSSNTLGHMNVVLQHGEPLPTVTTEQDFRAGDEISLRTSVHDTGWLVVRIADRGRPGDPRATGDLGGRSVAYLSPFFTSRRG